MSYWGGPLSNALTSAIGSARYELRAGTLVNRELEVISFDGVERMNAPYTYDVTFATSVDEATLQGEVFGFQACLSIDVQDHDPRVIQGVVVNLEAVGEARSDDGEVRKRFVLRIAPPLWILNHTSSYRVFQDRSALDIANAVLASANIPVTSFARGENYPPIPFVYQRGESDLVFLERVLATAGICFYFEHSNALLSCLVPVGGARIDPTHAPRPDTIMVLCDSATDTEAMCDAAMTSTGATDSSGEHSVGYCHGDVLVYDPHGHVKGRERVVDFRLRKEIRPGAVQVLDWNLPGNDTVLWNAVSPRPEFTVSRDSAGNQVHKVNGFATDTLANALRPDLRAVIEYQRDGAALGALPQDYYARRVLTQLRNDWLVGRGKSDCARLAPGYRFRMRGHAVDVLDAEYIVTEVRSHGENLDHGGPYDGATASGTYHNAFLCVPATVDPRPAKPAPAAPLGGEPAEVFGPVRGEIATDPIGRIKVRFRWGRKDAKDSDPSSGVCWVTWLERWGGDGYGTLTLPRVGSEVWVEFPQQVGGLPMAVGQLYSDRNQPPFSLPAEASKVGIRTNWIPGGEGWSQITLNDQPGAECIEIRAQRDMQVDVLNDRNLVIGGHSCSEVAGWRVESTRGLRHTTVGQTDSLTVGQSRIVSVEGDHSTASRGSCQNRARGDQELSAGGSLKAMAGERVDISAGGTLHTESGGASTLVCGGAYRVLVGTEGVPQSAQVTIYGGQSVWSGGVTRHTSETMIELACGPTVFRLTPDGVVIKAKSVSIEAEDTATVATSGAELKITKNVELSGQEVALASSSASLQLDSKATLAGSSVALSSSASSVSKSSRTDDPNAPVPVPLVFKSLDGVVRAHCKVTAVIDGKRLVAQTDGNGAVTLPVPKGVENITVVVWIGEFPRGLHETHTVTVHPSPLDDSELSMRMRLVNLGYRSAGSTDVETVRTTIARFQRDAELNVTCQLDSATRAALKRRAHA